MTSLSKISLDSEISDEVENIIALQWNKKETICETEQIEKEQKIDFPLLIKKPTR